MNAVTQSPLSIGQVLDRGFKLYRQSFKSIVPLTLISAVLGLLPSLVFGPKMSVATFTTGYYLLVFVVGIFGVVVLGAVFARIDDVATGRDQLGLGGALSRGFAKFLPLFGAGIIYTFAVLLGTVLLLIPGIWLSIALSFCFTAIVVDNIGMTDSFDVSRKLVAGNWWRVMVILSVAFIILFVFVAGVGALAALLLPIGRIVETTTSGAKGINTVAFLLLQVVNGLVSAVITPLVYAVSYATYRDLQVRKSGGDLAERIAAGA